MIDRLCSGNSNLPELSQRLERTLMIRRLKQQVRGQLATAGGARCSF